MLISKTYPIKGKPIYKAFEVTDEIVNCVGQNTDILALVTQLETSKPKPVIYFDDAARLDFFRSLPITS